MKARYWCVAFASIGTKFAPQRHLRLRAFDTLRSLSRQSESERFGGFVDLASAPPVPGSIPALDWRVIVDVESREGTSTGDPILDKLRTLELPDRGVEEESGGAEKNWDSTNSQSTSEQAESESQVATTEEGSNDATDAVLAQWDAETHHGGVIEMTSSEPN